MQPFKTALPVLLLLALFLLPSEARADGLVITGGSLNMPTTSGGRFTFQGQGITLNGWIDFAAPSCAPCQSGQGVSASLYRTGGDVRSGSGVIGGVAYDRLFYESQIRFTTPEIRVPEGSQSDVTLTVPFTFDGFMQACAESIETGPCPAGWVFSNSLRGEGLATLQLSVYKDESGNTLYSIRGVSYNFSPPVATPEPATLLLLGTGLAGVAARFRHKQKSRK